MKRILIALLLMIVAIGCTDKPAEPVACTMDAKICPDGSAVGRIGPDCEFQECPKTMADRRYVSRDTEQCAATMFLCVEGSEVFFDDSGCGCEAKKPKTYVSFDLDECSRIRYMCEEGLVPFSDDFGCGCSIDWGLLPEMPPELPPLEGKKVVHTCETRPDACTMDYNPVCGWFGQEIQCIKYPCAATYSNGCTACADDKVESWTEGECPNGDTEDGKVI